LYIDSIHGVWNKATHVRIYIFILRYTVSLSQNHTKEMPKLDGLFQNANR